MQRDYSQGRSDVSKVQLKSSPQTVDVVFTWSVSSNDIASHQVLSTRRFRSTAENHESNYRMFLEMGHISEENLELHYLGMIKDEAELGAVEEHLLACHQCIERAEAAEAFVNTLRELLQAD
jgi:hypothetical protein